MPLLYDDSAIREAAREFKRIATEEMTIAAEATFDRFRAAFVPRRLQRRSEASIGPRTRGLLDAFTTEVKVSNDGSTIDGRAYFKGDERIQTVARTQEFGATILPKRGKYLKFKVFRAYSRRPWRFKKPEQWIQVERAVVPARMNFFAEWDDHRPFADRILEAGFGNAVRRLNARLAG